MGTNLDAGALKNWKSCVEGYRRGATKRADIFSYRLCNMLGLYAAFHPAVRRAPGIHGALLIACSSALHLVTHRV
eukprot:scaffold53617_cov24-Tisochrysis_lutea.AAC.2